jgi:hypothetical protein|tara:strand:- start:136 stop:684 length:549 start_codon:yes stop_codon:yes gene_type:complete
MYFNSFPKIPYDSFGNYDFKIVTNLLRRVAIRSKVKSNSLIYDTYDVKNGDTPESIAYKLYGDASLHWVVLMVNNITDRYHQWPLGYSQFLNFINDKYDNVNDVHHYEIPQSSGNTKTKIEVYSNSALYTGDTDFYAAATTITNYEYEESLEDEKRKIRLLDPRYVEQFVDEFKSLMRESIL